MAQDPILQKEIWDARVKIVIGRFIMNAFTAFFVVAIVALALDNFVMGQMGDAFIRPVILNWGLPITGITLVVGFFANFLPKKKKIVLFTKILYDHKAAESQIVFPASTIEAECFTDIPTLGFHDGIRYRVWKTDGELCFFPVHPLIERIAPYERGPVSFSVISLGLHEVKSLEKSGTITRTYTTYDEKKKPVVGNRAHETVVLHFDGEPSADILFESTLFSLVAPAAPAVRPQPAPTAKPVAVSEPVTNGDNDIEGKLKKLQALFDKGLITQQEYNERKNKLLDQL